MTHQEGQPTGGRPSFEVLLINNGPEFDLPETFLSNLLPPGAALQVRLLDCLKPGSYAARNVGVQAAAGEWLVFTDADCLPDPHWLEGFQQAIAAAKAEISGAENSEPHEHTSSCTSASSQSTSNQSTSADKDVSLGRKMLFAGGIRMQASAQPNVFEVYDLLRGIPQQRYVASGYAVTANLCVHRAMAISQPFNEARFSGGDAEFSRTLVARGLHLIYLPAAFVHHPARDSWQAISTKVRRIKGGQICSGRLADRLRWCVRTLLPPVLAFYRYLKQGDFSLTQRWLACAVELRLWWVGVDEMLRLVFTHQQPERR